MKMNRRQYRIGELAKELKIEKFVLRFWEKELGIKPSRSVGGQRFYQAEDFETFKLIKTLLYDRKFTLAGAKKELAALKSRKKPIIASQKTNMHVTAQEQITHQQPTGKVYQDLIAIQEKLKKLHELL